MRIQMASISEIPKIAELISRLNAFSEQHIGYCGQQQDEIEQTLRNDWGNEGEFSIDQSFVVAFDGEQLVGVLGFDIDVEGGQAEVWGPFAADQNLISHEQLWSYWLSNGVAEHVQHYFFFVNTANKTVINFLDHIQAKRRSEEVILVLDKASFSSPEHAATELPPQLEKDFIRLHDQVFPDTYYSGADILKRLEQKEHRVFIHKEDEQLAGYIYVEADLEFGEASIEFFGVPEKYRGRGIGTKLIQTAISWFFTFDQLSEIRLCVGAENAEALHVYEKVGFGVKHKLIAYLKEGKKRDGS
ncbi:GNAT family N-acetyltransferase [Bacillus horti]|uniref:Ribosomal protein S18 acetylase RimI-like enzyme n=1 Tax=Caldalkalibacillus horti TaxID=77523 RepID=A0ABT9VWB0_9BACI|nr:GNAT family N-acetyltransferase [Bacillus horti]MDQ0165279.1 ribosomal protein S18 acetylase RimI-like enzyme [Bacillus horti]